MERVQLSQSLSLSRIAVGFWRLKEWKKDLSQLEQYVRSALDMGITSFDHADIYGSYQNEELFGRLLKKVPALRQQMEIVTKTGIITKSERFPQARINYYDTSYRHIIRQVEQSLTSFHTDHLDLLLIHRPDPLMNPEETARAFDTLYRQGKVLNFGVSNFTPGQFRMLNRYCDQKPVTNQVEISIHQLEHFNNGNMEFFLENGIKPMAWSPVAKGKIFNPDTEKLHRIHKKLKEISLRKGGVPLSTIAYAWLLKHPARIIPVAGSGKTERIKEAVNGLGVELTTQEWFELYTASTGRRVP